ANGAWLARTAISPDKPITSLRSLMSDLIEARLHGLMERAAASTDITDSSVIYYIASSGESVGDLALG
ncbi:MAG TPA: hypothetical protein VH229_02955, partial [Candidatus Udaeobacter sp.]|nr:hypothetical protein [Candidatus Udaeobacter sp.]